MMPRIRVATTADAAELIPLINAAYAVETFIDGPRTDALRLAAMMDTGTILLAEDDFGQSDSGRIVGCVYTEVRGARGYLGQLAVDPARQGTGLGRLMVEAAENHLRRQGCEALDITVLSLRPELPPLYRRFGFVETGTQEFIHPIPLKPGFECHCIVMSKSL